MRAVAAMQEMQRTTEATVEAAAAALSEYGYRRAGASANSSGGSGGDRWRRLRAYVVLHNRRWLPCATTVGGV